MFPILQVSENVVRKSADMAVKDPHGLIITLVSVAVVFTALIVLYLAYSMIGKAVNGRFSLKKTCRTAKSGVPSAEEAAAIAMALDQELDGETYAAIGLAMHQYLNDTVHDSESYIITIKRRKS